MANTPKTGEQAEAASDPESTAATPADPSSTDSPASDESADATADAEEPPVAAADEAEASSEEPADEQAVEAPEEPATTEAAEASEEPAAEEEEDETSAWPQSFDELDLPEPVRRAVEAMGWDAPTPVQSATFAAVSNGRDVLVQSQTGSGKTGAFCLPWLAQRFEDDDAADTGVQLLVLTPTRELAKQVCDQLEQLGQFTKVRTLPVYGGTAMQPQLQALRDGVHAVVGTPGRILDHIRRRSLKLDRVRMAVLDEADEMLSMGFLEDIHHILDACSSERQTCLFSATVPPDIERIARRYMRDPESVMLSGDQVAAAEIKHVYYQVSGAIKVRALLDMINIEEPANALIFCNTREETYVVASALRREGYQAEPLSSDLTQAARERVMGRMREGQLRFLVATDVASRGIDISHIGHVINYAFPENAESYVHRTGRTGRAGRAGIAISLLAPQDVGNHYYLKLQYPSIEFEERNLPPAEELSAQRLETKLDQVSRLFPELVAPEWTLLTRHLVSDPRGEQVVAYLLKEAMAKVAQRREAEEDPEDVEMRRPRDRRSRRDRDWDRDDRGRDDREGRDRDRGRGRRDRDRDFGESRDERGRGDDDRRGRRRRRGRDERSDRDERPTERTAERGPEPDRTEGREGEEREGRRRRRSRSRGRGRSEDVEQTESDQAETTPETDTETSHEEAPQAPPADADATEDTGAGDAEAVPETTSREDSPSEETSDDGDDGTPEDVTDDGAEDGPEDAGDSSDDTEAGADAAEATDEAPRRGRRRRRRRGRRRREDDDGDGDGEGPSAEEPEAAGPQGETTAPIPGSAHHGAEHEGVEIDDGERQEADEADDVETIAAESATADIDDPGTMTGVTSRRRRRRRRRRGRGKGDDDASQADGSDDEAAEAQPSSGDGDDADEATAEAGAGEGKRRRRRRRGGRRRQKNGGGGDEAPKAAAPPQPHVSQEEIVIDIDEEELDVVRDEFGEIDELDELTLKGRRRGVMESLQDEVELEDMSDADSKSNGEDEEADDASDDDDDDDADDASDEEAEGEAAAADGEAEASEEATAEDPREAKKRKRRRRRRRKKAAPPPPPELTAPPHKDFWEVWANKFTYQEFEDEVYLGGTAAVPEEPDEPRRPPKPADPPQMPAVEDEEDFVRVRLNVGRKHGKKAAHIRELLADSFGLARKAVRDLTVGEASSRFRIGAKAFEKLEGLVEEFELDGIALTVTRVEPKAKAEAEADASAPGEATAEAKAEASAEAQAEASTEAETEATAEAKAEASVEAETEATATAEASASSSTDDVAQHEEAASDAEPTDEASEEPAEAAASAETTDEPPELPEDPPPSPEDETAGSGQSAST